jgi:hypothetical protein
MGVAPSEIEVVDVVVKVVCREMSFEKTLWQFSDLVWDRAVGIRVDDGHLIPLCTAVRKIVSELRLRLIAVVDDARVCHRQGGRWLKIDVSRTQKTLKE